MGGGRETEVAQVFKASGSGFGAGLAIRVSGGFRLSSEWRMDQKDYNKGFVRVMEGLLCRSIHPFSTKTA